MIIPQRYPISTTKSVAVVRNLRRQAEFWLIQRLSVPKMRFEGTKTGTTGRVSGKRLPVGREKEGEREKERKRERGKEGEREKEKERQSFEIGSFALIV